MTKINCIYKLKKKTKRGKINKSRSGRSQEIRKLRKIFAKEKSDQNTLEIKTKQRKKRQK